MVTINLWASFLSNGECKRLGSFIIERSNPSHSSLRHCPPYVDLASTWHHSLSRPSPFLNEIVLVHIVQWSYVIKLHTWDVPVATQARTNGSWSSLYISTGTHSVSKQQVSSIVVRV